jgi:hypothetical protein
MNKNTAVLVSVGAVGVAGAGWGLWRMSERKSLAGMFEADPTIATLRAGYKALGAPKGMEWVRDGAFEEKAAELLPWFELSSAAVVFPKVLTSLQPLKESPQAQKGLEMVREALDAAGIKLPKGTDEALRTLGSVLGIKKGKSEQKQRPGMG